jgi:hypothetical protein
MKTTKQKSLLMALVVLFSVIVAPTIIRVSATSQDAVIGDITWEDIGAEGHYTFANVTYNTDGTGTDVLDTAAVGIGASVESVASPQSSFTGKLHTSMGFGIYADKPELVAPQYQISAGVGAGISSGPQLYTYETLSGFWNKKAGSGAGISVTNGTTTEELFSYNQKERYDTGKHDFSDNFDSDSNWWNLNVSTAANTFNLSSEYEKYNDSLTDASELDIDLYFNNAGENKESGIRANTMERLKGETFVVGYEDAREGIINDLRSYLALLQAVDFAKIVILSYNISTAKISYNMSETLTGKIKTAVDYWISESSSSSIYLGILGIPLFKIGTSSARVGGSGSSLIASIGSTLNNFGKSVKSGFISFGTRLKQFGARTQDFLTGAWNTARDKASDVYHTVGGTIKSALSKGAAGLKSGANFVVNIGKSAIKTGQTIVGKAIHAVQSFGSGILKLLTNPLLLILLIGVVCIIGYVILKKTEFL